MQRDLIKRELTQVDLNVTNRDNFFDTISAELLRLGYVRPSFLAAVKEREAKYPTGLPTKPEAIAIPHVDAEHVVEPFIAPIRLRRTVAWHEMGRDEVEIQVRLVFVLGFTHSGGHVQVLQVLLKSCQDATFMGALADARNADEYFATVHGMRGLTD